MRICGTTGSLGTASTLSSVLAWACAAAPALAEGATRSLADYSEPAVTFTVSIAVDPPQGTMAAGLEDSPPAGWTQIGNISNGGQYDPHTHKVKWGPLFSFPVEVSYDLLPPEEVAWDDCFVGDVFYDSGESDSIEGDQCLLVAGPIPASSEVGLAVLAILLIAVGGWVISRRRPTAT